MKQLICIIFFISLLFNTVQGKIWTVDNTGKVANYNNITGAIAAASDGDTLLLGGSGTAYTDINMTKKLCIIGTGFFLSENPNTIENKGPVNISSVTFSAGSDGSVLVGITASVITISTDAIVIRRCYVSSFVNINGNNNIVKHNFFNNPGNASYVVQISGTNNTIRNNYLYQGYGGYNCLICGQGNIIENNILKWGNSSITSSSFGNNIMIGGSASFVNCNPYNSIGDAGQFGSENGNQSYVTMSTVCVSSGTSDGIYKLGSSSPAKGAGLGGIDCGMYGGNDPYVLSGIPDIPVITSIVVPSRANPTNGLNVQLNIRSNK
jgi:hypothetical protein